MSGLINSIAGAVKGIANSVGDVISNVAHTVEKTVQAAINDPIGTIAKVAAVATGNAWALPLISGADTLAHGGDIGSAIKSAGLAYVATSVAGEVAGQFDTAAGTGAAAEGATEGAGPSVLGRMAGNVASSTLMGKSPLDALISGGVNAGVGELTSQIPDFDGMPKMAQDAIRSAMSSSLSSSLMPGQNPNQLNINSALQAGQNAMQSNGGLSTMDVYTPPDFLKSNLATVGPSTMNNEFNTPETLPAQANLGTLGNMNNPLDGMGTMNNQLNGMGNISNPSDIYGIGNMNQMGNVYGMSSAQNQMAQNNQMPMYARGGLIHRYAEGGNANSSSESDNFDLVKSLKSLGALTGPPMSKSSGLMHIGQMGSEYEPMVLPQLMEVLRSRGIHLAHGGQPEEMQGDRDHPNYDGSPVFRTGGLEGIGGKYVEGKGDGTSDDISAMLANGEYVFSADVVSALGNGSNKAGADRLGEMVEAIRARARSSEPDKLPPDAKSPLEYLKPSKGNKNG